MCLSRWSDFCISIHSYIRNSSFTCQKWFLDEIYLKFLTMFFFLWHTPMIQCFSSKIYLQLKKLLDIISCCSKYSGLKPKFSKCEVLEIGSLRGVEVDLCGIKCVNLKVNTIKILGVHFSYKNKLDMEKNVNRNIKHSKRSQNMAHEQFNFRR